jgi:hypothetical protein
MTSDGLRTPLRFLFAGLVAAGGASAAHAQGLPSCDPVSGSCVTVEQQGDLQEAVVTQQGPGNVATVLQIGQADYYGGPDGNRIALEQADAGNHATIRQVPLAGLPGYGGDDNLVLLRQSGGATADVYQEGSYNVVWGVGSEYGAPLPGTSAGGSTLTVGQVGWGNRVDFEQANGGTAIVTQSGEMNRATIIQQ